MRRTTLLAALILGFSLSSAVFADAKVVDTGHIGPIGSISLSEDGRLVLTGGSDGTVRRFEGRTGRMADVLQLSPFEITAIAVHPALPRIAAVESDGVALYRISVWDFEERARLYTFPLAGQPLSVSFSPQGTYLVVTRADWESVMLIDAERGSEVRNPVEISAGRFPGFGIVGSFLITGSEKTFLAYLPSGSLQYRDMSTGQLKTPADSTRINTLPQLTDLHFLDDGYHAIGRRGDELIAINILTGRDVDIQRIAGLSDITVDPGSGEILVLHDSDGSSELLFFGFSARGFINRYSLYELPDTDARVTAMYMLNRIVYLGFDDGRFYRQTRYQSTPEMISENRLATVDDLVPGETSLITTLDSVIAVHFETQPDGTPSILTHRQPNPFLPDIARDEDESEPTLFDISSGISAASEETRAIGEVNTNSTEDAQAHMPGLQIGALGARRLTSDLYLLFDDGGSSGVLGYFDPLSGLISTYDPVTIPPIVSLDVLGFDILTVNAAGSLSIANLLDQHVRFSLDNSGLRTAVFATDPFIVAAGQRSGVLRTTTLLINTDTSETVPLSNQHLATFELAYDSGSNTVYSVSIDRSTEPSRTIVLEHSGTGFERTRTVLSVDGEFFDASLAARRGTVFLSIGGDNYLKHPGKMRFSQIESSNAIPRSVAIYGNRLYSVNRDSSISLWDADEGSHLANFYLFNEAGWAALSATGTMLGVDESVEQFVIDQE